MAMTYGGMLYFPFKVSFMDEVPIELAEAKFGLKSTAAIMKLLCKIHNENGYYLKWGEEQALLFIPFQVISVFFVYLAQQLHNCCCAFQSEFSFCQFYRYFVHEAYFEREI